MDVVSAACISAVIRHVCTCVFVRTSPSVWFSSATLAAAFGETRVCTCACSVCQFGVPAGLLEMCVCVCVVCQARW